MTPAEIRAAMTPALVALIPDHAAIAAALSATHTRIEPRIVSARGLAERYTGGPIGAEIVMMKLEEAAATMLASADPSQAVLGSLLKRQLGFLAGEGLDFGSAALRVMLDQFVTLAILTQAEVDALKAVAVVPDIVSAFEVAQALEAA
jgi:hypothetical protein